MVPLLIILRQDKLAFHMVPSKRRTPMPPNETLTHITFLPPSPEKVGARPQFNRPLLSDNLQVKVQSAGDREIIFASSFSRLYSLTSHQMQKYSIRRPPRFPFYKFRMLNKN
ncbi:hypothetical protein GWI33_022515 [Rhynchophorus ferrugineus]|uniref:Uncharacterized protein n=1 Tax=Rhynchophorus ferrugineus TaxID=354439 RepID=A0A834HNE9_RHYFE|nr:hypothetical protein GWI33_022515 [Rhynchophorus ferrugineus]